MINIALPKGRLGEKAYKLMEKAGFGCSEFNESVRKLVFRDKENGISLFWVKPFDVCAYVESGVADVGVVGKDVLEEQSSDVYELLDLNIGKCAVCVAAEKGFEDDYSGPLRVATKFVRSAERYFSSVGRETEIIKLNGSIELAPVLGLSDVIFDIVETGETLKENGLQVIEKVSSVSARLIANKSSYKFKYDELKDFNEKLKGVMNYD